MKRLLAVALTGLLYGFGLVGCGDDAGFEGVIVVVTGDIEVSVIGPGSVTFGVAGGVVMKVQRTIDDPTPVPNVNISLFAASGAVLYLDPAGTVLAGNGFVYKATTDDLGVIQVFPQITTPACPGTTDLEVTSGVTAVIAADQETWAATISVDCAP